MKDNMKTATIDLKGKAYATVPARIKEFREQCPQGDIKTTPQILDDGQVMFTAYILRDKANEASASATGHSIGKMTGDKAFEKLETIAIGRALAILGFMASGDIASGEEMEEFYEYRQQQHEEKIAELSEQIGATKNIDELKKLWVTIGGVMQKELEPVKEAKKKQFNEN